MLKHCLKQCSSMQKAYRVRVVRRTYGELSRSCAAAVAGGGQRSKWQNWSLALAKRVERIAHCRGVRRNDLETLIISSHHPVSSRYSRPPLFSDVRTGDSERICKETWFKTLQIMLSWPPSTRDPSHVSCLVPPSHVSFLNKRGVWGFQGF
jgi:hypothetical protein